MKILKQGLCLALLGAGLVAVPATLAAQAATTPSTSAASKAARDPGLAQDIRDTARGQVALSTKSATGQIGFARVAPGGDLLPGVAGETQAAAGAKADRYLAEFGEAFGAAAGQLSREKLTRDGYGGWTAAYTQSYRGVPVFGAMLRAHINSDGALTSVNGYAAPKLTLSVTPRLSAAEAGRKAVAAVRANPPGHDGDADVSGIKAVSTKLAVYRTGVPRGDRGIAVLSYAVEVSNGSNVRDMVFLDANTGKLVNRYSLIDNALERILYESSPETTPVWEEGDAFPGTLNQDQQNLVLGSGESYWLFENAFGRDSYDDGGAPMRTVNNDPTIACPNANWNGVTTNYCNGVTSDDVVAHEWGHAYTEFTWNGIYQWQPGALNESYSDIWGETVDLINGRMDGDEGDITTKRADSLCSQHTPPSPRVIINSPASIAKICNAGRASFGPVLSQTGITDDVVLGLDPADAAGPATTDACSPLTNAAAVAGNIAIVDRGTCTFPVKVKNAQNAGAVAVIIGNTLGRGPFSPSGTDATITIPSVGIGQPDRDRIVGALASAVNVTMKDSTTVTKTPSYRWLMGEDSTAFGSAIRDMWAPTCLGDPGKVSDAEFHCTTDDGGGVHSNSGVPNHGYALLVDGGAYNGQTITGIGLDKAAAIYYQAMTQYQTPTTDFTDHADALEASCADLVGEPINVLTTATNAPPNPATPVAAADCTQVTNMIAAVELRRAPVQCNFQPLLKPGGPSLCGAGFSTKTVWSEAFEDGLTGWEKDSEIVYPGGGSLPWQADATPPGGRTGGVARGDGGDGGSCSEGPGDFSSRDSITSPVVTLPSGLNAPKLSFDHYVATEAGFDGGNVKVSINQGAFTAVPTTAYLFNQPNAALQPTNPMAGEDAFTGSDGGEVNGTWGTSFVDLTAVGAKAGDSLRFRFDMGRDGCGGLDGWYVDNVKVTTCEKSDPGDVASTTTLKIKPSESLDYRQDFRAKIKVQAAGVTPEGKVKLFADGQKIGRGTLVKGKLVIKVTRNLAVGTYKIVAEYLGSDTVLPSSDKVRITITR